MPHQVVAYQFIAERGGRAGLFMAPGVGKTLVAIRYFSGNTVLVVCRRDDYYTWESELEQEGVSPELMFFTDRGDAELPHPYECDWYFVTYDLLKNPIISDQVMATQFDAVVADESQMLRGPKSMRTKSVIRATRHIPHRVPMTGTPIGNKLTDVFPQVLFIDDGKTFGKSEWKFKQRYMIRSGKGWYKRRGAEDRVKKRMRAIALYVHEDDVLKLPPIRSMVKSCAMTGVQRRHFERVIAEWELELQDGRIIELDYVIAKLQKLSQISNGFFYVDGEPYYIRSNKSKLLVDLLRHDDTISQKEKVVVWGAHTGELKAISRLLDDHSITHVDFFGTMSRGARESARQRFRDDPSVRVFLGQADRGVGMNELIVADTAIYHSNSLKALSRAQSVRRIRRKGSEVHRSITYIDLVVEGSLDGPNLKALNKHLSLASVILDACRQGAKLRKVLT